MSDGEERDEQSTLLQPRPQGMGDLAFDLEVIDGPDRGKRYTIDATSLSRVLVGQSPMCELQLSDRAVSRRHVSLEVTDEGLRLTDLGSKNGSFVRDVRVLQILLRGGEPIKVGGTTLRVQARTVA